MWLTAVSPPGCGWGGVCHVEHRVGVQLAGLLLWGVTVVVVVVAGCALWSIAQGCGGRRCCPQCLAAMGYVENGAGGNRGGGGVMPGLWL